MRNIQVGNEKETVVERADFPPEKLKAILGKEVVAVLGYGVLVIVALYFVWVWTMGGHAAEESKRMAVIFWLFLLVAVFWSGFEQAGTSLNLFARDLTDRVILGAERPASWLQSVNALFIIMFAPVFGMLWVWLERRSTNPSIPMKAASLSAIERL